MLPFDHLDEPASLLSENIKAAKTCVVDPLPTDSFIARSAFQKAIRRGDCRTALRAAMTLMELDPDVLWKRLLVTGMEDIGVGEFDLFAKIVFAQGKRARRSVGDDWSIAATLISQACAASKCQAANDLHNIALSHPELEPFRIKIDRASEKNLLAAAADMSLDPARRYAAALHLLDGDGPSTGSVDALFDRVGENQPQTAVYRQAFTKSRLGLAVASVILLVSDEATGGAARTRDDELPPTEWIAGVPSYALDQYTRAGRRALHQFVIENAAWRTFARQNQISGAVQVKAAGELLFRAEGAVLKRRRDWGLGRDLYRQSATVGCFIPPSSVFRGLSMIREELRDLNRLRQEVSS